MNVDTVGIHAYVAFNTIQVLRYDVINWKHFPRFCPLVRGIHRSPVNSPHKANDAEQKVEQTIETPVTCDTMAPIMTSL